MEKNLTYIVTGCTGFVGSVFTKKLLSEGCSVVGLARSEKKANLIFPQQKPQFVYGDINDPVSVERLFSGEGEFVVIHTVAKVTIGEGDLAEAEKITVEGTRNLINICRNHRVKKLIHVSSTEALPPDFDYENQAVAYVPAPQKMGKGYPKAKSMADEIVLAEAKERGLNASLILLSCVLGAGDYTLGHVSQMYVDYLNGKLPASVKGGYNTVDINDVADVLPAIIEKSKQGESYIFADKRYSINDMMRPVATHYGKKELPALPLWVAYLGIPFVSLYCKICKKRPLYTATALAAVKRNVQFPTQKTMETFGFSPRPLEQTALEHVAFLQENGLVKQ